MSITIKDNLNNNQDESPVWIRNVKHDSDPISIPRYQLLQHKMKLDANGDHIFVECDPEFVPSKKIVAIDEEKKAHANKRANTNKTMHEIEEVTKSSLKEIKEFAEKHNVSLAGAKNKKEMLEKLEEAKVLY